MRWRPGEAAIDHGARLHDLRAARIHVARKEEHARGTGWRAGGQHERDARTVAPAGEARAVDAECVHDREYVRGHALVGIGAVVARAAAMAAAVDQDGAIADRQDGRHLIAPVAGMAQAAMQKDDRGPPP